MANWWLNVILIIIFIATAVLITISSVNLNTFKTLDANFSSAYTNATWASVIAWVTVALFVIAIIVGAIALFYAAPEVEAVSLLEQGKVVADQVSGWSLIFFLILLVLIGVLGVLSAIAANQMRTSSNFSTTNDQMEYAYHTAVGAAVLALLSVSIIFIWWIVDIVYYFNPPTVETTTVKPDVTTTVKEKIVKEVAKQI